MLKTKEKTNSHSLYVIHINNKKRQNEYKSI